MVLVQRGGFQWGSPNSHKLSLEPQHLRALRRPRAGSCAPLLAAGDGPAALGGALLPSMMPASGTGLKERSRAGGGKGGGQKWEWAAYGNSARGGDTQ